MQRLLRRRMRFVLVPVCAAMLTTLASGQETPARSGETGTVSGCVTYSDTRTPARAAQVLLVKLSAGPNLVEEKAPHNSMGLAAALGAGMNGFTQTGLDGRFEMNDVPAGRYIVLAQQSGAVNPLAHLDLDTLNGLKLGSVREEQVKDALPYLTIVTVSSAAPADAQVSLVHGASISGVVTYDDRSPAVGAQVHLLSKTKSGDFEEPNNMTMGMASSNASLVGYATDDAGHFRIPGLLPGTYAVRVTLQLNLLKSLGSKIKGILMLSMASPDSVASATKMDDGLSVYSGNVFSRKDLKPIVLGDGEAFTGADVTIPLEGMHSLQAHVEDSATGSAIGLAQVKLLDADGKETLRACFVDDHGNCTFEYVPDGMYTLEVANALDTSAVGKIGSENYDPTKAVHYGTASTKVQVSSDTANIVLQVAKAGAGNKGAQ
jgi:hypothetical protein